jgi:acyl-CoA thioester hydrolase
VPPFERETTVYWPDADAAGIVWFGHFFRYLEETEEELFRARGRERQALLDELGIFMPRTHLEIGFRAPARLNDRLVIEMRGESTSARRVTWTFRMRRRSGDVVVCEGSYRVACVDQRTFEARDFPPQITALIL